jgi:hypothetical protein
MFWLPDGPEMRWGKNISGTWCSGHEVMEDSSLPFVSSFSPHMARKVSLAVTGWRGFSGGFWGEEVKPGITQSVCIIVVNIVVGKHHQ